EQQRRADADHRGQPQQPRRSEVREHVSLLAGVCGGPLLPASAAPAIPCIAIGRPPICAHGVNDLQAISTPGQLRTLSRPAETLLLCGSAHEQRAIRSWRKPRVTERSSAVVRVEVLRDDPGLPLPAYAREGDAGLDLAAAAPATLPPGGRAL